MLPGYRHMFMHGKYECSSLLGLGRHLPLDAADRYGGGTAVYYLLRTWISTSYPCQLLWLF